jgi:hypothetical protein
VFVDARMLQAVADKAGKLQSPTRPSLHGKASCRARFFAARRFRCPVIGLPADGSFAGILPDGPLDTKRPFKPKSALIRSSNIAKLLDRPRIHLIIRQSIPGHSAQGVERPSFLPLPDMSARIGKKSGQYLFVRGFFRNTKLQPSVAALIRYERLVSCASAVGTDDRPLQTTECQ